MAVSSVAGFGNTPRRGLQDYEYLWLLSKKTGSKRMADIELNKIFHSGFSEAKGRKKGDWEHSPAPWYVFRKNVAGRISRQ